LHVDGSDASIGTRKHLYDVANAPFTSAESFVDLQDDASHLQVWLFDPPLLSVGQGLKINGFPHIPEEI
jgi:hypothetical protein